MVAMHSEASEGWERGSFQEYSSTSFSPFSKLIASGWEVSPLTPNLTGSCWGARSSNHELRGGDIVQELFRFGGKTLWGTKARAKEAASE